MKIYIFKNNNIFKEQDSYFDIIINNLKGIKGVINDIRRNKFKIDSKYQFRCTPEERDFFKKKLLNQDSNRLQF